MSSDQFGQLEGKVEKLLVAYNELKRERIGIQSTQGKLEQELRTLQGEVERLQSERDEVRARINSLLGKLEEIDVSASSQVPKVS